jgi:hypothetical protein
MRSTRFRRRLPDCQACPSIVLGMDNRIKNREDRLRRFAKRKGVALRKSRRRDPLARGYGTWCVIDPRANAIVWPPNFDGHVGVDLTDIETYFESHHADDDQLDARAY